MWVIGWQKDIKMSNKVLNSNLELNITKPSPMSNGGLAVIENGKVTYISNTQQLLKFPTILDGLNTSQYDGRMFLNIGYVYDRKNNILLNVTKPLSRLLSADYAWSPTNNYLLFRTTYDQNTKLNLCLVYKLDGSFLDMIALRDNETINGYELFVLGTFDWTYNACKNTTTNWILENNSDILRKVGGTNSISPFGYHLYANGWKYQWGNTVNPTFPIAFENPPLYVTNGASNITRTGMTIGGGYWEAWGY